LQRPTPGRLKAINHVPYKLEKTGGKFSQSYINVEAVS